MKVLEAWADTVCNAADDLLAPICAEAGRVLSEMPDENMTEHLPPLPARLFRALYEAVKLIPHERIIHVFGATGGGRDKTKRAEMGEIAARAADIVIVTTDDSYDEDPAEISKAVVSGANKADGAGVREILDRKEAIGKALSLAQKGDMVLITGKGSEQAMVIAGNKKIPWSDKEIVKEALDSYT